MNKFTQIDFNKCNPEDYYTNFGKCKAVESCTKKLLEQEDRDEAPMLLLPICVLPAENVYRSAL